MKKKRNKKCDPFKLLKSRAVGFYYTFTTEQPLDPNSELLSSKMAHKTRRSREDLAYFLHHFPLLTDKLSLKWRIDYVFDFAREIGGKVERYAKEYRIVHFGKLDDITGSLDEKIDKILFNDSNTEQFQLATIRAEIVGTKPVENGDYGHEFKKV